MLSNSQDSGLRGSSFQYRPHKPANNTNLLTWTDAIIAQGPPCSWIRALGSSEEKIKPKGNTTSNQSKNNIIATHKGKCKILFLYELKIYPLQSKPLFSNQPPTSKPHYSYQPFSESLAWDFYLRKTWIFIEDQIILEDVWRISKDLLSSFKHFPVLAQDMFCQTRQGHHTFLLKITYFGEYNIISFFLQFKSTYFLKMCKFRL